MKTYVGAYGTEAKKIENNKIIDEKNQVGIVSKLKEFFRDECVEDKCIEDVIATSMSIELVNSLFEESLDKFILVGRGKEIKLQIEEGKKIYINLERLAKYLGKEVDFVNISDLMSNVTSDRDEVNIKDSTVSFYKQHIASSPAQEERVEYIVSTSNGIRIVADMFEQAVTLRCILDQNCKYEIRYAFFNSDDNSIKFTNKNKFDYKTFINSVIEAEHYQLAITMCEGCLRNTISKMAEILITEIKFGKIVDYPRLDQNQYIVSSIVGQSLPDNQIDNHLIPILIK